MIIAGIDEAGLGPVLGPLVVTATAFSVDGQSPDVDMWRLLSPAVRRKPSRSRRGGGLAIGDSKKLYSRSSKAGLEHLERACLAALASAGRKPQSLRQLLSIIAPGAAEKMPQYPWYNESQLPLPRKITSDDAAFAANGLQTAMDRHQMRLLTVRSEPVLVGEFNRVVRATRNKSRALFSVTSRLLQHLWDRTDDTSRVYVDRQGGRIRYLPSLQRSMGPCDFKVIREDESLSAYRITGGRKRMEVFFASGAEDSHLPVALASMVSKYVRELFMLMFNRFWGRHVEDIVPTAGYYTDGRRFFGQIQPAMERLALDTDLVYRCR